MTIPCKMSKASTSILKLFLPFLSIWKFSFLLQYLGREYHAVVEWAPVQRVPKKPKKVTKSGGVESDPKYIAFLEALEKEKNNAGNTSEYFMETDSKWISLYVRYSLMYLPNFFNS